MKPCPQHQQTIAWLAVDALDSESARSLRVHLDTCPGCRGYFDELSKVAGNLKAAEIPSDVQVTAGFHSKLMRRLEAEAPASIWERLAAQVQSNWRLALPAAAAAVVLIVLFRSPNSPVNPAPPAFTPVAVNSPPPVDLAPTVANYQRVASRSIDEFNDLLTRQGRQNLPAAPVYTAGMGLSTL